MFFIFLFESNNDIISAKWEKKTNAKAKTANTHIHEQHEIEGKNSVKKNKQNHHQTAHTATTTIIIKKKNRKVICFSNFLVLPSLFFSQIIG